MIGSLISVQFCPSHATKQTHSLPTKKALFCRKHKVCFDGGVHRLSWAHVLSAGKPSGGSAHWSHWCECRWWPEQHTGYNQRARGTARGDRLEETCVRQNKDDHIRTGAKQMRRLDRPSGAWGERGSSKQPASDGQMALLKANGTKEQKQKKRKGKKKTHENKAHSSGVSEGRVKFFYSKVKNKASHKLWIFVRSSLHHGGFIFLIHAMNPWAVWKDDVCIYYERINIIIWCNLPGLRRVLAF